MPDSIFHALRGLRDLSRLVRALPLALRPVVEFDYMSLFLDKDIASARCGMCPTARISRPSP